MSNPLWADIQAQADNLGQVADHLYGPELARLKAAAEFLKNDRPLVFVGMASAAYLCMPAEYYLCQQGRYASTAYASDALYAFPSVLERVNVVINSRSGETAEIVKLSQALADAGLPFVAITNEPDSSLARGARHVVWVNSRKDDLVSINIVTAMMTATLALAAETLGRSDAMRMRADLDRLIPALDDTLARASQGAGDMAHFFREVWPIYLLYRGASKGSAYNGRLVLEEVARRPAVPIEAAEFRQGSIEVVDGRFGAVVFAPEGDPGTLNLALAQDIQANGGRLMLVRGAGSQPDEAAGIRSFHLPVAASYLRPVLEVVPMQLLAYRLAEAGGYEPGVVRYLSKVITTEV